jgi:hypothetical protein
VADHPGLVIRKHKKPVRTIGELMVDHRLGRARLAVGGKRLRTPWRIAARCGDTFEMKFDLRPKDVPASYYGKGDKFFWSFRAAVGIECHGGPTHHGAESGCVL